MKNGGREESIGGRTVSVGGAVAAQKGTVWNASRIIISDYYIFPTGAWKMRFVHRGFCAEDRVPVGTRAVAENRGE